VSEVLAVGYTLGSGTRTLENYFNYFTEIEEQFRKGRVAPVLL